MLKHLKALILLTGLPGPIKVTIYLMAGINGVGFHSPQECMRILGNAVGQAQEARILLARVLAKKGITEYPRYPDVSRREQAWETTQAFIIGNGINLLP